MKVDIIGEMLAKHTDAEIIEHLYRCMLGVLKNYKISLEKGNAEAIWASLGDVEQATTILGAMHKRNEDRLAQVQQQ